MSLFVHLHVHSEYSPMYGASTIEVLCQAAKRHGATSLALTDTNGLYGAIRFIEVAREYGLRPILGAELRHQTHRALCLIKDHSGYANLCQIISQRHCHPDFDLLQAVRDYRRGLIIASDDPQVLMVWKRQSKTDLYVELTPGALMHQAFAVSRRLGLPPVATNRVAFASPDEFPIHRTSLVAGRVIQEDYAVATLTVSRLDVLTDQYCRRHT